VTKPYQKPYLDSTVFIGYLKDEVIKGVERGKIAEHILQQSEEGTYRIYTSTLTLAEVYHYRGGTKLTEQEADDILLFFERDFFEFIDVDREIGEQANRFCREFGLRPNDAIHLACALRAQCDVLFAWDERMLKTVHPDISVEEPKMRGQLRLDGMDVQK